MKNQRFSLVVLCASCFTLLVGSRTMFAGDWPQILGPGRNGHAADERLADNWLDRRPTKLWTHKVGEGYAGPAVAAGQLYVFHREDPTNVLDCLDAVTGKPKWRVSWKARYRSRIDPDAGPRCVPLVHGDRVFVLTQSGQLHSVSTNGKKQWTTDLARETRARDGYFGFGSTPILVNDTLMVNVGGREEQSILGIDPETGKKKWSTFADGIAEASYSAPTERKRGKNTSAVFVTRLNLVEVAPEDGQVLSQMPFGSPGTTVNAATPLMLDEDRVFVTASYRIGAKCVRLTDNGKPTVLWGSDAVLSSQYPTPIHVEGLLFGVHGREDGAPASLRCVDAENGDVKWKHERVGMAHLIYADGKALMLKISGELVLFRVSPEKYEELGSISISSDTTRSLPALADGRFYLRDTGGELAAWQLPEWAEQSE